jgi:hypothetical protein
MDKAIFERILELIISMAISWIIAFVVLLNLTSNFSQAIENAIRIIHYPVTSSLSWYPEARPVTIILIVLFSLSFFLKNKLFRRISFQILSVAWFLLGLNCLSF